MIEVTELYCARLKQRLWPVAHVISVDCSTLHYVEIGDRLDDCAVVARAKQNTRYIPARSQLDCITNRLSPLATGS